MSYTSLLDTSPALHTFLQFKFGFKPSPFSKILVKYQNQVTASDLPLYDIFVPQKVPLLKISEDVVACDWWFAPPPFKGPIKNPGNAYGGNGYLLQEYLDSNPMISPSNVKSERSLCKILWSRYSCWSIINNPKLLTVDQLIIVNKQKLICFG